MWMIDMGLPERLLTIRKDRKMSQQRLADAAGVHVTQLRRYEAGRSQPTADVIRNIAIALRTSTDSLLFDPEERAPEDKLKMHFEAIANLDDEEKKAVMLLLEGVLLKHEAGRWK